MSWLEQDALLVSQKCVDSMFVPGAVAIQKWNFPLFLVTNVTLDWASKDFSATQEALHDRAVFPSMNEKLKCQFESRLRGRLRIYLFKSVKIYGFETLTLC